MEGPKLSPDDNIVMLLHVVDFGLNIVFFCGNCYYRVKKSLLFFYHKNKNKTRESNWFHTFTNGSSGTERFIT